MIKIVENPPLIENYKEFILVKEKFLDHSICDQLINEHQTKVSAGSSINYRGTFNKYNLDKNHYIHNYFINLWDEVTAYFGTKIDFIEPYNIKKYQFGNFYDYHVDNFSSILDRKLTFVVQLSDSKDYRNGNLIVAGQDMTREKGSVIVFPSNFKHKVDMIGFGERWTLITWAWGSLFNRGY
jgi:Rps23 Pro-64 3,4-dihydroxylase Tpa1-like proline 4-hydroxylase